MPDTQQSYIDTLSPRRLALLRRAVRDYRAVRDIQALAQADLSRLFDAVHERESWLAALPRQDIIGAQFIDGYRRIDPGESGSTYAREWTQSFLETILELKQAWPNYSAAVAGYDTYCATLPDLKPGTRTAPGLDSLGYRLGVAGFSSDMDATALGRYEAHWQMRRLLQVFFARYSAEIRLLGTPWRKSHRPPGSIPNDPRPDLREFSRRQNLRPRWMAQTGKEAEAWHIDEALYLLLYLDKLAEETDLPSWTQKTRAYFLAERLLIPGLRQVNKLIAKAQFNYPSWSQALDRWRDHAEAFAEDPEHGPATLTEYRLLQYRCDLTACLMNTPHAAYLGRCDGTVLGSNEQLEWVTKPIKISDAFEDGALSYNKWPELDHLAKQRRHELYIAQQDARRQRSLAELKTRLAEREKRLDDLRLRIDTEEAAKDPLRFAEKLAKRQRQQELKLATMAEEAEIRRIKQAQEQLLKAAQRAAERKQKDELRKARDDAKEKRIAQRLKEDVTAPVQLKKPPKPEKTAKESPQVAAQKQPQTAKPVQRFKTESQAILSRQAKEQRPAKRNEQRAAKREEMRFKRGLWKPKP